jgi:hypothetical protein
MKSKIVKSIVVTGLLTMQPFTHAGSPDGLIILVISSRPAEAYLAPLKQYFERYRPGSVSAGCDDGSINIGDARFASGVYKIAADLAVAAVTDAK